MKTKNNNAEPGSAAEAVAAKKHGSNRSDASQASSPGSSRKKIDGTSDVASKDASNRSQATEEEESNVSSKFLRLFKSKKAAMEIKEHCSPSDKKQKKGQEKPTSAKMIISSSGGPGRIKRNKVPPSVQSSNSVQTGKDTRGPHMKATENLYSAGTLDDWKPKYFLSCKNYLPTTCDESIPPERACKAYDADRIVSTKTDRFARADVRNKGAMTLPDGRFSVATPADMLRKMSPEAMEKFLKGTGCSRLNQSNQNSTGQLDRLVKPTENNSHSDHSQSSENCEFMPIN